MSVHERGEGMSELTGKQVIRRARIVVWVIVLAGVGVYAVFAFWMIRKEDGTPAVARA